MNPTAFEVVIDDQKLMDAAVHAFEAASEAAEAGELGIVACQVLRTNDGRACIRGQFLSHEHAQRVCEAVADFSLMVKAQSQETTNE